MTTSFDKLQELLAKETFPLTFTFKVVGRSTEAFRNGARELESLHPGLKLTATRDSAQGNHVSLTYIHEAESAEIIIAVYRSIQALPDVLFML